MASAQVTGTSPAELTGHVQAASEKSSPSSLDKHLDISQLNRQGPVIASMSVRERAGSSSEDSSASQLLALDAEAAHAKDIATEFQLFVADSLGHALPLFGYNLFGPVPSTFAQGDRIPVTANYIIGPGDEILIRVWGQIEFDARAAVDRSGDIYLSKVGSLHVAGLKYSQLSDYLRSAIGRVYQNFDMTVNLGQLRSIQVFVVGQARRPGAYTISALSTLVNALFACGGPSTTGSMRHIQLKRNNAIVTDFDIYDLLLKGDKSEDTVLQPGDVIFIPPVGPLVAIDGSVNTRAVYELKGNSTLGQLLQLASGLTNVADGQYATVERIYDRSKRKVEEFALDDSGLARTLQDGDLVRIDSVSPKFESTVTLRGNVAKPGRYPWREGMRVRDLIPTQASLITRDYWAHQNTSGRNKDVHGLPEINWEYALVSRMGTTDLSNRLLPFNLGKAIDDSTCGDNLDLRPGDIITIFSQADVRIPIDQQSKYVYLEGEVKVAGLYRAQPGETLRHLVARAGGLTPQAYLFGSQFLRETTRIEQQARLDEVVQRLHRDAQRNASLLAVKASSSDNASLRAQVDLQQAILNSSKQLKATGRIVLDLRPNDNTANALPELALEDGDRFYVPNRSSSISVVGEVVNPDTFLFKQKYTIRYYISKAGGPTRFADPSRTFVLRADGSAVNKKTHSVFSKDDFNNLRLMPGDAIVIPPHLPRPGITNNIKDWGQILSQFGLGVAATRVLTNP